MDSYELMLIAGILRAPKTTTHIVSELNPEDVQLEPLRHIATAIRSCADNRKPLHVPVIWAELRRLGLHEVVGGVEYIRQVAETFVLPAGLEYYADEVRSAGSFRRFLASLVRLGHEGTKNASEARETRDRWMADAASEISRAMVGSHGSEWRRLSDVLEGALTDLEATIGQEPGISTGLNRLDALMRLHGGDLVVIAARPGMGKTSLMLQILTGVGCMGHGGPVAFFSLEMPEDQLALRLVAERAGVPLSVLRTQVTTHEIVTRLRLVQRELDDLNLWVDSRPGLTVEQMRAGMHRLELREGALAAAGVDYLQICGHSQATSGKSTADSLGHITKGLKAAAKERACPVLVGSQLSRDSARSGREPGLHDLRDSGSIESDADVVAFIHGATDDFSPVRDREIIVSKVRNGEQGRVGCKFHGRRTVFVEDEWHGHTEGR